MILDWGRFMPKRGVPREPKSMATIRSAETPDSLSIDPNRFGSIPLRSRLGRNDRPELRTDIAYSAESERGFHVIVNPRCVSGAEDTDMGSGVHDDIGDGRIPAMPYSDSQPTRNVSVAAFVAGRAAGVITQIAPKACCARLHKRYGGRHTAKSGSRDGKYISLESRQWRTGRTTIQGLQQQSQVSGHASVHIAGE
jgi:hypothetical protein